MGLAMCWYVFDGRAYLNGKLIPKQLVVQHTILQRSQSTRTVQIDSRPSRDEDGYRSLSSTPRNSNRQAVERQMEALLDQIAQDLRVKKQP
jgi:hypothetical protein